MAIDLADVAAGIGGFIIHGEDAKDNSGFAVSSAGDFNGDGFADLLIGAHHSDGLANGVLRAGSTYVVFGQPGGFPAEIFLADVAAGIGGFVIQGQDVDDYSGIAVASAGDINGDGFADLLIGANHGGAANNAEKYAGDSYIVFGHAGPFPPQVLLDDIAAGNGGFVLHGTDAHDLAGRSVSSAGDFNGDGFADFIIGARHAEKGPGVKDGSTGDTYVVFGHAGGFPAAIDLANVEAGIGGFVVYGIDAHDEASLGISSGDINGDGFDDLIIGVRYGDGPTNASEKSGEVYVVFGHAGPSFPPVELAEVATGIGGFVIYGDPSGSDASPRVPRGSGDQVGFAVSSADVNGDGFADIIIGARYADGPSDTRDRAGGGYVVFGHAGPFPAEIHLVDVAAGTGGFVIHGQDAGDLAGWSASSAGNVNGDGYDDIIIAAKHADSLNNARVDAGDTYVIFGRPGGFPAAIDLVDVAAGIGGFVIHGQDAGDQSGFMARSAGDVDGDGFADLIIGAPTGKGAGDGLEKAGNTYIVFGSPTIGGSPNHVTHLGNAGNNHLIGTKQANVMVGGRGDDILEGRGGPDVLIGGAGNDTLTVGGKTFLRVDGGSGFDTLAFSGRVKLADSDFRRVSNIESLKLGSGTTDLTLGPIASHAIGGLAADDFRITIDGSLATNAAVKIEAGALNRPLTVNLAHNTAGVTLRGGSGDDVFNGGSGNDTLIGGDGDDTLKGGAGNDVIHGGAGNDILRGNEGQDSFVFNTALNASTNVDRIPDFNVADDTIWLDNAIFTTLTTTGVLDASQFFIGAAAHDADDRIIYNSANGQLLYDADGDGPGAAVPFAKLPAGLPMTHEDFLVM